MAWANRSPCRRRRSRSLLRSPCSRWSGVCVHSFSAKESFLKF